MPSYEELQRRHVAEAMAMLPGQVERLSWSPEQLSAHRSESLRQLVRTAQERSPWHRRRLAGVDPDALTEEGLAALPVMTKEDLMGNFDEILTDPNLNLDLIETHIEGLTDDAYLLDRYHAVASGGSSGRRGVFVYDWDGWTLVYLGLIRYELWRQDANATRTPGRRHRRGGRRAGVSRLQGPVSELLEPGTGDPPAACHPSARRDRRRSQPDPAPRPVELPVRPPQPGPRGQRRPAAHHASPHLGRRRAAPPRIRQAAEEAWGVPVQHLRSLRSRRPRRVMWVRPGLHLVDDLVIVEAVDHEGRPVKPGNRSDKLFVTNLFNTTLPLIRYEITDEITSPANRAPAGRPTGSSTIPRAVSTTRSVTATSTCIRSSSGPRSACDATSSNTRSTRRAGAPTSRCAAPARSTSPASGRRSSPSSPPSASQTPT